MKDYQCLIHLAGNIYDAALDSARWPGVLAKITGFVGGQACLLITKNSTGSSGKDYHQFGIEPRYLRLYAETYCDFDPMLMAPCGEPDRITSFSELLPFEVFRKSEFFSSWLQPQGLLDAATAVIDKTEDGGACLSVWRGEASGKVDDGARRRLQLVVPHLRRALAVARALERRQFEATTFADILDNLSAGIILVDAGGGVVHANEAGHAIQRAGDFLRLTRGRLTTNDCQADQILRDAFAAASKSDLSCKAVALPLTARNGEHYVAHVLPLTTRARCRSGMNAAVAALFIRKAEMDAPSSANIIRKAYNLTPTELRVLLAIVDVGGVPEVAENLGVADSTIKTHLSRLFEKTGAGRQADLVKVVAGFSSLLVN